MAFHPYLFFDGDCREAMTRYQEVFGGELVLLPMSSAPSDEPMPPETADLIMHAALTIDDGFLMASDDPTSDGAPPTGVWVSYNTPDVDLAQRVFDALADGGEVMMPMEETFWSPRFGTCRDRFGIPWMIGADSPADGAAPG